MHYLIREVADAEKAPINKEYVTRWELITRSYFGIGKEASLVQIAESSHKHPVFKYQPMRIA